MLEAVAEEIRTADGEAVVVVSDASKARWIGYVIMKILLPQSSIFYLLLHLKTIVAHHIAPHASFPLQNTAFGVFLQHASATSLPSLHSSRIAVYSQHVYANKTRVCPCSHNRPSRHPDIYNSPWPLSSLCRRTIVSVWWIRPWRHSVGCT